MKPLYLLRATPHHGQKNYSTKRSLTLEFSAPLLAFTCSAGIQLFRFEDVRAGIKDALPLSFRLRNRSRRIHVRAADGALRMGEVYLLRITPALRRADGKPFDQTAQDAPASPYARFGEDKFYQSVFTTAAPKDLALALDDNFPKPTHTLVDLNVAESEHLLTLPGMTRARATALVSRRSSAGQFADFTDLLTVSGINEATLKSIAPQATVLGVSGVGAAVQVTRGRFVEIVDAKRARVETRLALKGDIQSGSWAPGADRAWYLTSTSRQTFIESVQLGTAKVLNSWPVPAASDMVMSSGRPSVFLRGAAANLEERLIRVGTIQGIITSWKVPLQPLKPVRGSRATSGTRPLCLSQDESQVWMIGLQKQVSKLVAFDLQSGAVVRNIRLDASLRVSSIFPSAVQGNAWLLAHSSGSGAAAHLIEFNVAGRVEVRRVALPQETSAAVVMAQEAQAVVASGRKLMKVALDGDPTPRLLARLTGPIVSLRLDVQTGFIYALTQLHGTRRLNCMRPDALIADIILSDRAIGEVLPVGLNVVYPARQRNFLTVFNPNSRRTNFTLHLRHEGGGYANFNPLDFSVAAGSRDTILLDDHLIAHGGFSCKIDADGPIVAERSSYWNRAVHQIGVCAPAMPPQLRWYFAEGFRHPTFRNALELFNPGNARSTVTLHLLVDRDVAGLASWPLKFELAGRERRRLDVDQYLPDVEFGFGLRVEATSPITVERSMYWLRGAQASMGVPAPSTQAYFAGGSTQEGATTFILLAAPAAAASVQLFLRDEAGSVITPGQKPLTLEVGAGKRNTISIDDQLVGRRRFSVEVRSSAALVAEMSVYPPDEDGYAVPGEATGRTEWYFSEGWTGGDFQPVLCVFNPSNRTAQVTINAPGVSGSEEADGGAGIPHIKLPAFGSVWIELRKHIAPDKAFSLRVKSNSRVVVHREMSWGSNQAIAALAVPAMPSQHIALTGGSFVPPPGQDRRLDLNRSTQAQLEILPAVGPVKAQAIIDYRHQHGRFKDELDLLNVPGFGGPTFEAVRGLIKVERQNTFTGVEIKPPPQLLNVKVPEGRIGGGFIETLEDGEAFEEFIGLPQADILSRITEDIQPHTGNLTVRQVDVRLPGRAQRAFELARLYDPRVLFQGQIMPRVQAEIHRRMIEVRAALEVVHQEGVQEIAAARNELAVAVAEATQEARSIAEHIYDEAIAVALQEAKDEVREQVSSAKDEAELELDDELAELEADLAELLDEEPGEGDDDEDLDGDPNDLFEEAHAEWEQEVQDTEDELSDKQDELEELKGEEPPEWEVEQHDAWQDDVDDLESEISDLEDELQDLQDNEPELEDFQEGGDEDNEEFEDAHGEWEEAVEELEDAIDEVEQALADLDSEIDLALILSEFEQEFLQRAEEERAQVINEALVEFQKQVDEEVATVTAEIAAAETTLQQNYNRALRLVDAIISSDPGARQPLPLPLGLGWMFDIPAYHIEQQLLHAGGGALIPVQWVGDQFAPPGFNLTLRRVERQVPAPDGGTKTARYELEKEQYWYLDDLGLPLALTDRARVNWVVFGWARIANQAPQLKLVRGAAGDEVNLFYTDSRLERMAWTNNRELRFSYEQETEFWRLTQVADSLNRVISYRYDESLEVKSNSWQLRAGLLSLVKFPGKGSYGYLYDSRPPDEPVFLPLVVTSGPKRIQDEPLQFNGPPYVYNQYHLDNLGRAAIEVSYTYIQDQKETHETIINEPGRLTRMTFRAALDEDHVPLRWDLAELSIWPAQDGVPAPGPPAQLRKLTTDALGNVILVQEERQGVPYLLTSIAYEGEQAVFGRPTRITLKTPGGETLREVLYKYHPVYKDQLTAMEGDVAPNQHWGFDEDGRDPVKTGRPTSQTVFLAGQPQVTTYRYDEYGNLVEMVGPDGRTMRQVYGERNGLAAAVLTEYREGVNQVRAWRFEAHPATGWLMGMVQPDGNRVRYERDAWGRITALNDPLGRRVEYEYRDDRGQVVLKKPDGCLLIMEDDGLGRVLNRKLYAAPSADAGPELVRTISYAYDPWGNISARTDTDGTVTTWQRDWSGRPLSVTYPDQSTLRWQYDDRLMPRQLGARTVLATMVREIDQENANRDALFDALSQELGQIVPLDGSLVAVTALEYNRAGQLTRMYAPRGGIEQYRYDELGRMVERVDALGAVERSTYYPSGQLQSLTGADGATTSWELDEWGRVIAEIDATGNKSGYILDEMDRIIEALDPAGSRWLIRRDAKGAVVSVTDPAGGQTNYQYDVAGRLLTMTDAVGATTRYAYDRFGDLIEERDALDRVTRYERALNGRVTAKLDRAGGRWTMEYDLMGRMTAGINPLGQRTDYLLNKRGEVNAIRYFDGRRATFKRDLVGRMVKREGPGKLRFELVYDSEGNILKEFDADGVTWSYEYDLLGRVLKTIDGAGHATAFNWSAGGLLLSVTGPSNAVWRYAYDQAGRMVSSINPVGVEAKIEYDAAGRQVSASLDGATARWSYDSRGMLTTEEDPTGRKRFFEYDAAGRIKAAWRRPGEAVRFEFDALGRVVAVTDAEGHKSIYEYGPHDQVSKAIDPLGQAVTYERDVMGRLTAITNALGARREWSYDPQKPRVKMLDALRRAWVYTYDAAGRLETIQDPAGSSTRMDWTDGGLLRSIRDAAGSTWLRAYDALGLLTEIKNPDALATRYQYNASGLLVRVEEPDGRWRTFDYDAAGRVSAINGTGGRIVAFTRNAQDQVVRAEGRYGLISLDYDGSGRVVKVTKPDSPVIVYGYDDRGLVERLEFDGRVIQYAHNRAEQLVEIKSPEATVLIERDALGRIKSRSTSAGGREDAGYDAVGRLISLAAGSIRLSRAYDAVGNLIEERREGEQNPTRYEYDALDQLVRVRQAAGGERVFLYDAAGNRTQENVDNKSVRRYTYSRSHRLLRIKDLLSGITHEVEHDAAGRITALPDADGNRWQLRYDDAGALMEAKKTSSGGTVKWQRDALMNVVGRSGSGGSEKFLAADSGFLRWSQSSSGKQIDWTPQGGLDDYAARRVLEGGQSQGSLSVQQPDATILGHLNAAGAIAAKRLGPFGERQQAASGNGAEPLAFAGRPVCPESGIVDMRARPYAPWLGRFLAPDPLLGALSDPRQRNPYVFVGNNPLKRRDPLGLQWSDEQFGDGDWSATYTYEVDDLGYSFRADFTMEVSASPLDDYERIMDDARTSTPLEVDNSLLEGIDTQISDINVDTSEILDRVRDTQQQVIHEVGTDILQSLLDATSALALMIAGAAWNIAGILKEGAFQAIDLMGSYLENITMHEYQHQMWSDLGKAAEMGYSELDFLSSMGYNFIASFITTPLRAMEAFKQGDYFNLGAELSNVYLTYHPMAVRAFNRIISALPNSPGLAGSIKSFVRNTQLKAMAKSIQAKYLMYGARETPAGIVYGGEYVPAGRPGIRNASYNPSTRIITVYEQAFTQGRSVTPGGATTGPRYNMSTRMFWETLLKGNSAYKTLAHEWWHNIQNMTMQAWYESNGARARPQIPYALREVEFTLRPDQATSGNSLAGAHNMAARLAPLQGFQAQIVLLIRELIAPDFGPQGPDPSQFPWVDQDEH